MKTIRHVLAKNDKAALELAYKLAAAMMDRPITPEQGRKLLEEK